MKPVNTNPTPAQREAGNYKKGHLSFHGLGITIENPRGSIRRGVNDDGKPWAHRMLHDYGYLKRTMAHDGDQVDCFVGPDRRSTKVWIVDQMDGDHYDEAKVLLGFSTAGQALNAYRRSYGARYDSAHKIGSVVETNIDALKQWLGEGGGAEPVDPDVPMASGGVVDDEQGGGEYQEGGAVEPTEPAAYFADYADAAHSLFGEQGISDLMKYGGIVPGSSST